MSMTVKVVFDKLNIRRIVLYENLDANWFAIFFLMQNASQESFLTSEEIGSLDEKP